MSPIRSGEAVVKKLPVSEEIEMVHSTANAPVPITQDLSATLKDKEDVQKKEKLSIL